MSERTGNFAVQVRLMELVGDERVVVNGQFVVHGGTPFIGRPCRSTSLVVIDLGEFPGNALAP